MFRFLRITVLLLVLLIVALTTWHDGVRNTRWTVPLYVAIYPVVGDSSAVTKAYVGSLDSAAFEPIDRFFAVEAARYRLRAQTPVKTRLRAPLMELPPQRARDAGVLATVLWSLKLRFWAWRVSGHAHEPEDIRIYVLYRDPALTPTVPHSAGLAKGHIGVVYAFATPVMGGANDVVIAHEMLHTLGATDKYDPADDAPRFPDGYGDPRQRPLFPQRRAEIMAGRRMLAPNRWEQPADLADVVIGQATANEIRWPMIGP
ncbi:MAG: hypothetical protein ACHQIL_08485 [Steroidobacterales bacterium]